MRRIVQILERKESDAKWAKVTFGYTRNTTVQRLFSFDDEEMRFVAMKRYIIAPKSEISNHRHPWEHLIYILDGAGIIQERDGLKENLQQHLAYKGKAYHIPIGTNHSILNPSLMKPLIFLSIIPIEFDEEETRIESGGKTDEPD